MTNPFAGRTFSLDRTRLDDHDADDPNRFGPPRVLWRPHEDPGTAPRHAAVTEERALPPARKERACHAST